MWVLFIWIVTLTFVKEQTVDLSGRWTGIFTQDFEGRHEEFRAEFVIRQKGKKISGKSYVYADSLRAVMELEGKLVGGTLVRFEEQKIIRKETVKGMEWCLKKGELILKMDEEPWRLEGLWEGETSFKTCTPGRVYLKKVIPRV